MAWEPLKSGPLLSYKGGAYEVMDTQLQVDVPQDSQVARPRGRANLRGKMRCPIKSEHTMVEIALGVFQCPFCGYGPSNHGHRPFWALSNVEADGSVIDAVCVRYDEMLECYSMSGVSWLTDERGFKLPQSFSETEPLLLSTQQELEQSPLPVVVRAKGKWDFPPAKPKLREGMFPSPLGLKEISLSSARQDKS